MKIIEDLDSNIISHPFVDTIEFNAVAPTILTKALETVVVKEARKSGRRRTPGQQIIKHLASSGDIRSAISSLEFLCLRGDTGDIWSGKVTFTKTKKPKSSSNLSPDDETIKKLKVRLPHPSLMTSLIDFLGGLSGCLWCSQSMVQRIARNGKAQSTDFTFAFVALRFGYERKVQYGTS